MKSKIILVILIFGILYKLFLTWNGNFLFNMDNARDMVDVREMVVLGKMRLTGPTSAIEGLFNGPAWYYLLVVPFIISGGHPYASILMEIMLWVVGGFFLLKLVSRWSSVLVFPIGLIWITSNYIGLTTLYAFNPNPVTLLAPLFIFLLLTYLETDKFLFIAAAWFLGGLFFNFEMNFGIFIPPVILAATFFTKRNLVKKRNFWLGSLLFIATLLPQVLFDLKHQFIMTNSVINYLRNEPSTAFNIFNRFQTMTETFYSTFLPTLMNHKILTLGILIFSIPALTKFVKEKKKDMITVICLCLIFIPFLFYLILPVSVNPWHLGGEMTAGVFLTGFVLKKLWDFSLSGKVISLSLSALIIWAGFTNLFNYFLRDRNSPSMDPSLYKNEIAAIDYVYKYANGKNFKVYTYLPSVYDYPYQYLFWWYGKKTYGYIPGEYVYSPNKPQYIPSQNKFQGEKNNFSGLVFLIKEPNRNYTRFGWEADYKGMQFISKEMVGPLEVETRKE